MEWATTMYFSISKVSIVLWISFTIFSTVRGWFVMLLSPYPNGSTATTLKLFDSSSINGVKSKPGAIVPYSGRSIMVVSQLPTSTTFIYLSL